MNSNGGEKVILNELPPNKNSYLNSPPLQPTKKLFVLNNRFFILSLASAWCIGIGFRMLIEGLNKQWFTVEVSGFFGFFDWGVLFIIGIILFIFSIKDFYRNKNEVVVK